MATTTKTPFSAPAAPTGASPTVSTAPAANPIPTPPRTEPVEPIGMTPEVDPKSLSDRLCWASPSDKNQTAASTDAPKMPDLSTPDAVQAFLKDNPSAMCYMSKAEIIAMLQGPEAAAKFKDGVAPEVGSTPPSAGTQPAPQPATV